MSPSSFRAALKISHNEKPRMAESRMTPPDFGTREEDWPDIDIDSDTSEYAENMARSEAASHAIMERRLQQQRDESSAAEQNDPVNAIPEAIYDKARDYQDQLTQEERNLLLSCDNLVCKALALPDSLTTEEVHDLFGWSAPDVVRDYIQRASNGTLSTPAELYTKAKDAIDRGQFESAVNNAEVELLAFNLHTKDEIMSSMSPSTVAHLPGYKHAHDLITRRLGLDAIAAVTKTALLRQFPPREPPAPADYYLEHLDRMGGHWPTFKTDIKKRSPMTLFSLDKNLKGLAINRGWIALSEGEREAYRAQSETIRRDAWTWCEKALAEGPDRFNDRTKVDIQRVVSANQRQLPPRLPSWLPPPPVSKEDQFGGPWPPVAFGEARPPLGVFMNDRCITGYDVHPAWSALPEGEKEAYRAQSEIERRNAWAWYENAIAEDHNRFYTAPPPPTPEGSTKRYADVAREQESRRRYERESQYGTVLKPGEPSRPRKITGLGVFCDELGVGERSKAFQEALGKWRALPEEQTETYKAKAAAANAAAEIAYQDARSLWSDNSGVRSPEYS
ncbi:hypothetical protein ACHAQH_003642 [Verticillium albo-atrum]